MECEFCEIDGRGQHAPRCPVALETRLAVFETALRPLQELDAEDRRVIRVALWSWAGYARERANEIAQDRNGLLRGRDGKPIPTSAVGTALDEAARAERLHRLFSEDRTS